MTIFIIILSCLLWVGALFFLARRPILGPALSYCAMLAMTFARSSDGSYLFPLTNGLLYSWLVITMIVMFVVMLQALQLRAQTRGMYYIEGGALAGMLVGIACVSMTSLLTTAYALMIIGTAVGTALGLLFYTNTPGGREIKPGSGFFLKYLLAKGFPTLITVAQLGIIFVIIVARQTL